MPDTHPAFAFYEKVRVNSPNERNRSVNGELGAVLGRVEDEAGAWHYTVSLYSTKVCWDFRESELLPTGEHAQREDFYSGSTIRVDGNGRIVNDS
ncbi:hypothetical protein ETAA8_31110 [Anatilimnocola aggregata]|uniref:Uncharacterized protein n=1 Tax=Anatilimnocola aggregata TaxID=2528021 RepID=A0A517YCV3_9BACT|nr:Imm31 family immunity protein [Anatilimnocola aggregata]QDU28019.1 hypothetical protein ETAA8_31110 [Anatilimnocola aggregata]